MPKFTYTGVSSTGEKITKTVEATDRFGVYEAARADGNTVTTIADGNHVQLAQFFDIEKINYFLSRVKQDELIMVTRNLSSMLTAGLPLSRALSVIERQSSNPRLHGIIKDVQAHITKGDPFYVALSDFPKTFNDLYVAMVKAGEESGGLSESLQVLSLQMERSSSLRKKIKGAMMYPSIVLIIMCGIGVLMMMYVVPSVADTFRGLGSDLPATTKTLIAISDFMNNHAIIAFSGIFAAVFGVISFLKTKIGKKGSAWVIVRLPVIGTIAKEANAAVTARTLSSLLTSGVDVLRALAITEDVVQNVFFKRVLHEAYVRVEKGTALSETFVEHKNLYPILVGEMIAVGEETGQIANMLKELAIFYENEVDHKTKDLSTIIEPLLMVVIGGMVGFFALAIIAPIYSIGNSI